MKNIKLIACDTDGVLLEDTYSPILYKLSQQFKVPYTAELERNLFSRSGTEALKYVSNILGITTEEEAQKLYRLYFSEREKSIENSANNPILDGASEFVKELEQLDVKIICYGGLEMDKIDVRGKPLLSNFERYICTEKFRPGLKEIVKDFYHLDFSEVLFIDDVNTVAEEARKYNVPFIGVPTEHSWGFQKQEMEKTKVKYMVSSVKEITVDYLERVDNDRSIWNG